MSETNGKTSDDRFLDMVHNVMSSRREFLQRLTDPRRDIDAECGYPKLTELTAFQYKELYDYDPIARRVNNVWPSESWKVLPVVYEEEEGDVATEFESAWDNLSSSLSYEPNYVMSEQGNMVLEYLKRSDILCGIGSFGVMLLGFADGKKLHEPLLQGTGRKLKYIRVFPQSAVQIATLENDVNSPRHGMPKTYNVTINDPQDFNSAALIGATTATVSVDWTRIVHHADNLESSEWAGAPRMRSVLKRLLDLQKLYGGSAEMYWRGAFPGISLETHPQLGGQVKVNQASLRDMMENYENGLSRYLALMGMSAKTLSPTVVDPTPQIKVALEAICIVQTIPMRIFMGSERGELASTQDDDNWDDRVAGRQNAHLTPRHIGPFVNRCIWAGVLPPPRKKVQAWWPSLTSRSATEKASVAAARTGALTSYVSGGGSSVVPEHEFLTYFLGFTDDEAEAMLGAIAAVMEGTEKPDTGGSPLLGFVGGITGMLEMFQKFKDGAISEESLRELIKLFYKVDDAKAREIIAGGLPPAPDMGAPPVANRRTLRRRRKHYA